MIYIRLLPILSGTLALLLMEMSYLKPQLFYVGLVLLFLLFLFASRVLSRSGRLPEKPTPFLLLPGYFTFGLMIFILLLTNFWLAQVLFWLNSLFIYFYFRTLYYRFIRPEQYEDYHFHNLSAYGNFLAFYFLSSSAYGLQSFLSWPIWILLGLLTGFIILIIYQMIWAYRIEFSRAAPFMPIISLVLLEIAWALSFLTLSHYILGLIISVCYYILVGLVRFYLQDKLERKIVNFYLIYGFIIITLVLLTSRWL